MDIEPDGEDYFWERGIENDREKENYLNGLGIQVIRFEDKWVFEDIQWVLGQIKAPFNHP